MNGQKSTPIVIATGHLFHWYRQESGYQQNLDKICDLTTMQNTRCQYLQLLCMEDSRNFVVKMNFQFLKIIKLYKSNYEEKRREGEKIFKITENESS